jgi:small subunit ribosomal protein S18
MTRKSLIFKGFIALQGSLLWGKVPVLRKDRRGGGLRINKVFFRRYPMENVERPRRKRRFASRKKRTLDPNLVIDYKYPDVLKRFVTERGKIIPRRISGATAKQQRQIALAVKQARYLGLLLYSVSHTPERGFTGEMAAATVMLAGRDFGGRGRFDRGEGRGDRGEGRFAERGEGRGESKGAGEEE